MTFGDLVEDLMLLNSRLQVTHQHLEQQERNSRVTYSTDLSMKKRKKKVTRKKNSAKKKSAMGG
jgi:hypothetical protein